MDRLCRRSHLGEVVDNDRLVETLRPARLVAVEGIDDPIPIPVYSDTNRGAVVDGRGLDSPLERVIMIAFLRRLNDTRVRSILVKYKPAQFGRRLPRSLGELDSIWHDL